MPIYFSSQIKENKDGISKKTRSPANASHGYPKSLLNPDFVYVIPRI